MSYDVTLDTVQKQLLRDIWLNYYNNTLLGKGIISSNIHRKMKVLISKRSSLGVNKVSTNSRTDGGIHYLSPKDRGSAVLSSRSAASSSAGSYCPKDT